MIFWKTILSVLIALFVISAHAQASTTGLLTSTSGNTLNGLANSSCSAVEAASQSYGYGFTVTACSSDPVIVGSTLTWFSSAFGSATWTVATITATPPANPSSGTCVAPPIDYVYASQVWALAFSTVIFLWFVSTQIGVVLGLIRGRR
ncbi:MAG: hypothetical protein WCN27_02840 [Alphaproteobacteria bacterium]